ncbi:hypothetical protein PAMP_014183 [Pampus punctatissimus]
MRTCEPQDLGCCIRQEIVDFSSSVLDQRPTISEAATLSQCLPNVCPCSGTENVDTVPKVPLQVPPPFMAPTQLEPRRLKRGAWERRNKGPSVRSHHHTAPPLCNPPSFLPWSPRLSSLSPLASTPN